MKQYLSTFLVRPSQGCTPDDVLGSVVQAVDALTIVEASSARPVGGGLVSIAVRFLGLNDNEARVTATAGFNGGGTYVNAADSLMLREVGAPGARSRQPRIIPAAR